MDRGAWCKITNKLTIDVGINYYLNRKDKTGEGGGFRMGNTGIPVADSFQYLAKLIQYCKV